MVAWKKTKKHIWILELHELSLEMALSETQKIRVPSEP
jgi:hypothetical protein